MRAARQFDVLARLPRVGIVALMSFTVITPTVRLALGLDAAPLVVDLLAWCVVAAMFDNE